MSSSHNTFPATVTDTITVKNNQTILNINMSNVTKLVATNYLTWSLQVRALLDGYDLVSHLDGSAVVPATTVTTDDVVTENPDFKIWKRQDRLIYSSLIGAISTPIQSLVSRTTTAAEVWSKLSLTYAKPSRGHIRQLKAQLKHWKKEDKTIDVYLQGATTRLDQLAILGSPVEHEDQIDLILEGLPSEYKQVIDQVEGRDTPPTITELHERLLNHEAKLLSAPPTLVPITANAVQQRYTSNNYRNQGKSKSNNNSTNQWQPSQQSNWQPSQQTNRPESSGPKPYLGKCQICGVQGHSAKRCSQLQTYQQQSTPWQPRANLTMGSPYSANNWLVDSGATHHITSDLNNLSMHQPYNGGDDVMVADGSSIPITHTGEGSQHGGPVTPRQN